MLAHLHTLQSENRQMQSRIMELASQREFYIAINTKLRQTLTEHDLGEEGGREGRRGREGVLLLLLGFFGENLCQSVQHTNLYIDHGLVI